MDGQPRKDNNEQTRARRPSKRPKKIGKQRRAREKQGTQMTNFRSPTPAAGGPDRQTKKPEFRQNARKFKPNGPLGADVSVPNLVRKDACGGNFSTATHQVGSDTHAYATNENEENPNLNPKCVHLGQGGKERQAA